MDSVICTECESRFEAASKSTFLGFRQYMCSSCYALVIYPLRPFTRVVYLVMSLAFVVVTVQRISDGKQPTASVLLIAVGYAFWTDWTVRKQVSALQDAASEPDENG